MTNNRSSRKQLEQDTESIQEMCTIRSKLIAFISADGLAILQNAIWIPFSSTIFSYFLFGIRYEGIITEYMGVRLLNNSIVTVLSNSFPSMPLFLFATAGLRGANYAP